MKIVYDKNSDEHVKAYTFKCKSMVCFNPVTNKKGERVCAGLKNSCERIFKDNLK